MLMVVFIYAHQLLNSLYITNIPETSRLTFRNNTHVLRAKLNILRSMFLFPPKENLMFEFYIDLLFKKCRGEANGGWFYLMDESIGDKTMPRNSS